MFEGLDWRAAARRSAIVIAAYLALFYVASVAFPQSFALDSRQEIVSLLANAAVFFLVFTVVYAFVGRNRNRRMAEAKNKDASKNTASNVSAREDGAEPGPLKGRQNPNTSRRKTRRRR